MGVSRTAASSTRSCDQPRADSRLYKHWQSLTSCLNLSKPLIELREIPIPPATMSGRILKLGGVVAVGGAGYYLYRAGGDPKAAERRLEGMSSSSSPRKLHNLKLTLPSPLQPTRPRSPTTYRTASPAAPTKPKRTHKSPPPTSAPKPTTS